MNVYHAKTPPHFQADRRLTVDEVTRQARLNGRTLHLSELEFDILAFLSRSTNQLVTYEELITAVWGSSQYFDRHALEVHISRLRTKLGESGRKPYFIETVRGYGYRFKKSSPREHLGSIHYDSEVRVRSVWLRDWALFGRRPDRIIGTHWMGLLDGERRGANRLSLRFVKRFFETGVRQTTGRVPVDQVKSVGVSVEFQSVWIESAGTFEGIYTEFFRVQPQVVAG